MRESLTIFVIVGMRTDEHSIVVNCHSVMVYNSNKIEKRNQK